jgi:hypothetical protein
MVCDEHVGQRMDLRTFFMTKPPLNYQGRLRS